MRYSCSEWHPGEAAPEKFHVVGPVSWRVGAGVNVIENIFRPEASRSASVSLACRRDGGATWAMVSIALHRQQFAMGSIEKRYLS